MEGVVVLLVLALLVLRPAAYIRFKCQFPNYLQVADGIWVAKYVDGDFRATVSRGEMKGRFCSVHQPACAEYERFCQKKLSGGRYVVSQVEKHQPRINYLCLQFIKRSLSVIQIRMSRNAENQTDVCNESGMVTDDWPLISIELIQETKTKCPFSGGYDFDLSLSNGEKICTNTFLPLRFESECIENEGISIRFRDRECTKSDWELKPQHTFRCLASWVEKGKEYILVTDSDTNRYWCMRVERHQGRILHIYFFLDKICDSSSKIPQSRNYIKLSMHKRIIPNICSDEFPSCQDRQLCRTNFRSHCLLSCGECQVDPIGKRNSLEMCSFPESYHGRWIKKARMGTSMIAILNTTVVIEGSAVWQCIETSEEIYSWRRILLQQFDNGCYPRFTCLELQHPAPSVMRYRVGEYVLWPVNHTHNLKDQICKDNRFSEKPPSHLISSNYHILPLVILVRQTDKKTVSCNLPGNLGTSVAFRDDQERQGCLLHNIYFNTHQMVLLVEGRGAKDVAEYTCLASMKFIGEYDTIVTETKGKPGEYLCWMLIDNKELVILHVSSCTHVKVEAIQKQIEQPLLRLYFDTNRNCSSTEERWEKRILGVKKRNSRPVSHVKQLRAHFLCASLCLLFSYFCY